MTVPLITLATGAVLLALIGTPAWPWFHAFLAGTTATPNLSGFLETGFLPIMLASSLVVFLGLGVGWRIYAGRSNPIEHTLDPLEQAQPQVFRWLQEGFYVDALYKATIIRWNTWIAAASDWLDQTIWSGAVSGISFGVVAISKLDSQIDSSVVNRGFDQGCNDVIRGGGVLSRMQSGLTQHYLRLAAGAVAMLIIFLLWGS